MKIKQTALILCACSYWLLVISKEGFQNFWNWTVLVQRLLILRACVIPSFPLSSSPEAFFTIKTFLGWSRSPVPSVHDYIWTQSKTTNSLIFQQLKATRFANSIYDQFWIWKYSKKNLSNVYIASRLLKQLERTNSFHLGFLCIQKNITFFQSNYKFTLPLIIYSNVACN